MQMTSRPIPFPNAIRGIKKLVPGKTYQRHHRDSLQETFVLVAVHYLEPNQEWPYKVSSFLKSSRCSSLGGWYALIVTPSGPNWYSLADCGVTPYRSGWNPWNYLTEVSEPTPKPKIEPEVTLKLSREELRILIEGTMSFKREVATQVSVANTRKDMALCIDQLNRVDGVAKLLESME